MAGGNGNSEGVGGVVGTWRFGKAENFGNHINDLLFVGSAVARDGLLNLIWSNFDKVEIVLSGGKQDYSARLRDSDSRCRIFSKKKFLDGYNVGVESFNERVEFVMDFQQTILHESLRAGSYDAVVNGAK